MLLALLLTACPEPEDSADSAPVVEQDPPDPAVCEPAVIKYDGPDEPKVGDVWKFWLTCDDVVQMGVTKASVDPVDAGSLADGTNTPEITWSKAGDATLHIQSGRFKGERVVTVGE